MLTILRGRTVAATLSIAGLCAITALHAQRVIDIGPQGSICSDPLGPGPCSAIGQYPGQHSQTLGTPQFNQTQSFSVVGEQAQQIGIQCARKSLRNSDPINVFVSCAGQQIVLPQSQQILVTCAARSRGTINGFIACIIANAVDIQPTPQQQLSAQCVAENSGQAAAAAACTAAQLTARELKKCLSNGFGGLDGCFGGIDSPDEWTARSFDIAIDGPAFWEPKSTFNSSGQILGGPNSSFNNPDAILLGNSSFGKLRIPTINNLGGMQPGPANQHATDIQNGAGPDNDLINDSIACKLGVRCGDLDPSKFKALQPVFFATNRKIVEGPLTLSAITYERSRELKYGLAVVSVPKSHTIGTVERPPTTLFWKIAEMRSGQELDEKDFRIQSLQPLGRQELVEDLSSGEDSVLLFVHGYNVSFEDAIFKAAQIAFDANFTGSVLVFSWPAAGELLGYDHDYMSALASPEDLLDVLRMISDEIGKKKLYVVVHSLGNQILVDALQQATLSKTSLNIAELVLAAPDVDVDVFSRKEEQIKAVGGNITIYASAADRALLASNKKTWGNRLGYVSATGPVVFNGVETIDVTAVGDDMLSLNHSTFSSNRVMLDDLGRIITTGGHPPTLRTPIFRSMPDRDHAKYWVCP